MPRTESLATQKAKAEIAKLHADRLLVVEQTRKAKAEASAAGAAPESPSAIEVQKADAIAQKEIAEAERDAATARREQLSALIPDVTKVKASTLQVATDGPAIGSSQLTFGGIGAAAERVAENVQTVLGLKGDGSRKDTESWILVTSDADLASPDGTYQEVTNGIVQLEAAAKDLLTKTDPKTKPLVPRTAGASFAQLLVAAAPVIGALAGAIPGVLSLLSSERSVRSATVAGNDLAAAAAVAGALRARTKMFQVLHDDFRLIQGSVIQAGMGQISQCRQDLVARKLLLIQLKVEADAKIPTLEAELKELREADPVNRGDVNLKATELEIQKVTSGSAAARIAALESLLTAFDAFVVALRTIPAGATRSALSTATLQEQLHGSPPKIGHVLLVKSEGGSATQTTDNRPLMLADKYVSIVDASITYMLISTEDSTMVDANTVTAVAIAAGTIGKEPPKIVLAVPGSQATEASKPPTWHDVYVTPRRDPGAY